MDKYKYQKTWFLESEIRYSLFSFLNSVQENDILEIGCYEGSERIWRILLMC